MATSKKAAPAAAKSATKSAAKSAPAKSAKPAAKYAKPAAAAAAAAAETKGPGKIEQIIALHKAGKTNAEIVEAGFNKTTVSIQVSKYKKDPKGWEKAHA